MTQIKSSPVGAAYRFNGVDVAPTSLEMISESAFYKYAAPLVLAANRELITRPKIQTTLARIWGAPE